MLRTRVIPILLLSGRGLVKTVKFKKRVYIGDPINTVKIFNDKEVDELVIVDIDASIEGREPDFEYIESLASQCFMPLAYGGGITTVKQVQKLLAIGVEKVIINTAAINSDLIASMAVEAGSQSIVVSIDVKKTWMGKYEVRTQGGGAKTGLDPVQFVKELVDKGAGEIILNSIDRDGTQTGYDLELIKMVSSVVNVPVIACGGAGSVNDFSLAVRHGASAVAAGSLFVFTGPHRAVLINFPKPDLLESILN